jgi:hypothetical protein
VTADGLTVEGTTAFNNNNVNQTGTAPKYNFFESDITNLNSQLLSSGGKFFIRTLSDDAGTVTKRFQIDHSTGDISFFEDTGTTAKFFWDSSAERLGIGTTSPDADLDVRGTTLADVHIRATSANSIARALLQNDAQAYALRINSDDKFRIKDETADADRLVIDTSGNVGIGTDSPQGPLQVALSSSRNLVVDFDTEGDSRTALRSIESTANNLRPIQIEGQEIVLGTAAYDQTVSAEAMRIDSSGNVLVNTSSVSNSGKVTIDAGANASGLYAVTDASAGYAAAVLERSASDGDIAVFKKGGSPVGSIGTQSSNFYLGSGDVTLYFSASGDTVIPRGTNGNARSGAIDLGNSGNSWKDLYLSGTANVEKVTAERTNGVCAEFRRSNDGHAVQFFHAGALVGSVAVTSTATAYNTSSDQRLKENIADADDAGSKVDAIQVRKFDWKADGSHQDYGMVAQELNTVAPEAVTEGDTEEDMMSVDYSKLVPMLVKEIQSLRARVAQLETN